MRKMKTKEREEIEEREGGGNTRDGILITNVADCVISCCRCYDNQGTKTQVYGIHSIGTSNYNIINGCNCRGNLTGSISLSGANNINTDNIT